MLKIKSICSGTHTMANRILCGGGCRYISAGRLGDMQSMRLVDRTRGRNLEDDGQDKYPRRIFSGIQPTGGLHLGNYLGAIKKWSDLQKSSEEVTYCIVDMHAITLPQDPILLHNNIMDVAATLLACDIDPDKSTVFVQSTVKEHAELCWILGCFSTMARLGHLPQYKEKTRTQKEIPLGLFVYPVLQAADILLYKATHVPVGEDQVQHIQLTQHLAKIFNSRYGETFPLCRSIVDSSGAARVRSLRDPGKKMSKSDPDKKATIYLLDEPDEILEKVKKAVTDFTSDVTYDPENRPGVSNLISIHALVTGMPIDAVVDEARTLDTARYKLRVAEAIIEHLTPIRERIKSNLDKSSDLLRILEIGAARARLMAQATVQEVRDKIGLGVMHSPPPALVVNKESSAEKLTVEVMAAKANARMSAAQMVLGSVAKDSYAPTKAVPPTKPGEKPVVPIQRMRVEKKAPSKPIEFRFDIMNNNSNDPKLKIGTNPNAAAANSKFGQFNMRNEASRPSSSGFYKGQTNKQNTEATKKPEPPNTFKLEPLMSINLIKKPGQEGSTGSTSNSSSNNNNNSNTTAVTSSSGIHLIIKKKPEIVKVAEAKKMIMDGKNAVVEGSGAALAASKSRQEKSNNSESDCESENDSDEEKPKSGNDAFDLTDKKEIKN